MGGAYHAEDTPMVGEGEGVDEEECHQSDHHEILGGVALADGVAEELVEDGRPLGGHCHGAVALILYKKGKIRHFSESQSSNKVCKNNACN